MWLGLQSWEGENRLGYHRSSFHHLLFSRTLAHGRELPTSIICLPPSLETSHKHVLRSISWAMDPKSSHTDTGDGLAKMAASPLTRSGKWSALSMHLAHCPVVALLALMCLKHRFVDLKANVTIY